MIKRRHAEQAMDKRSIIPFIDLARAVAPLLVLWAHLGPWWCIEHSEACVSGGFLWSPVPATTWVASRLQLNGNGGHLGVLLFFLVSGFIISHIIQYEQRTDFAIKRFFQVGPMLIIGLPFAYATSSALMSLNLPPTLGFAARSVGDLLRSMTLLDTVIPSPNTNGVTWSLVPEVGFYTILVVIWPALSRWPLGSSYLLIALVPAIDLGTMAFLPFKPAHYFFLQIEFILVGRAIYLWWAGISSSGAAALLGSTALATLAALHFAAPYSRSELLGIGVYSVVFSWAFAIAIFMALMLVRRCPRPLSYVSDSSYSIYLLHIPIGSLVLNVLCLRYGLPIRWAFLVALPTVLAISYLTYRLVEAPGQRVGRKIAARLRALRAARSLGGFPSGVRW